MNPKKREMSILASHSVEVSASIAGAVAGYAIGDMSGAVVGGLITPSSTIAVSIAMKVREKRIERATRILNQAFAERTEAQLRQLENDGDKLESVFFLVETALKSDESLATAFAKLISETLNSRNSTELERIELTAQSLAGLGGMQLRVLVELSNHGGTMTATDISDSLMIPERELRFAVRDLEMRGMIKDNETHPIEWILRELGAGVVAMVEI